jgi:hypothetical protein
MASLARIPLGAPGIYLYPDTPVRTLTPERMDVCAFVGVAPRGPVRVPVITEKFRDESQCVDPARPVRRTVAYAVESFDEYEDLYGGFEGPGLLSFAVAAFFEQGGRRAYIARIVHDFGDAALNAAGVAAGDVPGAHTSAGPLRLRSRNEGIWGNALTAAISFTAAPLLFTSASKSGLEGADVKAGALLRLTLPGGAQVLRFVVDGSGTFETQALEAPEFAETVEAALAIDDNAGRRESHDRLGLSPDHPHWMGTVLCADSRLVYPDAAWIDREVTPDSPLLRAATPAPGQFTGGEDRNRQITPDDFFDPSWVLGDEDPGDGIQCLVQIEDLGSVVVPDLYSPRPLAPFENILTPVSLAGPTFARCVDPPLQPTQVVPVQDLDGLRLDPRDPADLARIIGYQKQVADLATELGQFVALLDVPPGLTQRRVLAWRGEFATSYAAAYMPWLTASGGPGRDTLVRVPPSAIAAGIIARREIELGVPYGPANEIASGIVGVDEAISPARHDELHPLGINVFLQDRDGMRLTAARTLSRDPDYRQLSVRRLVILLRRTLERQMQWAVFEPNGGPLQAEIRGLLTNYLRQFYRSGAFKGATEREAFFVRCDAALNPQRVLDAGQLIAEVGIAPAEPLEFIVLRIAREGDGSLTVEE